MIGKACGAAAFEGGDMERLKGFERAHLRGLAHRLKPVVQVGRTGVTEALVGAVGRALESHELIKVTFVDLKEKEEKRRVHLPERPGAAGGNR